jgi:hypothetical protein
MSCNLKSYLKALGTGYTKTALIILIGLWLVPFTLRYLTRAEYGRTLNIIRHLTPKP